MTGKEKGDHFNTGDCLIEVITCAGLTVFTFCESCSSFCLVLS